MSKTSKKRCFFSEFQNGGIPPFRNFYLEGSNASPVFCKKCQAIVNALPVSLGFTNSKLHKMNFNVCSICEILDYLPLFTQLQAAPSIGHLLQQSLHLGIPKRRDPSFSEFRFGGIPPFGNSYLEGSLISEIVKSPPFL